MFIKSAITIAAIYYSKHTNEGEKNRYEIVTAECMSLNPKAKVRVSKKQGEREK